MVLGVFTGLLLRRRYIALNYSRVYAAMVAQTSMGSESIYNVSCRLLQSQVDSVHCSQLHQHCQSSGTLSGMYSSVTLRLYFKT